MNETDVVKLPKAARGLVGQGCLFFVNGAASLQMDGHDCGLHVMAAARSDMFMAGGWSGGEGAAVSRAEEGGCYGAGDEGRDVEADHRDDGETKAVLVCRSESISSFVRF